MSKTSSGNFFEDFRLGQVIQHATPRTVTAGDVALYTALYGPRFAVQSSDEFARALSFNGLANAFHLAGINAGRHVAPLFAGDTVFAWSEILDRALLPGRDGVGALRLRTVATKNRPCADFPLREGEVYHPAVILELDYWVLAPR